MPLRGKKPVRKAVRKAQKAEPKQELQLKKIRKPEKSTPIRKAQEANLTKLDDAIKYRKTLELVTHKLEALAARAEVLIKTAKGAKKPIDLIRAWYGSILGNPEDILCKDKNCWRDIIICEYACDAQCSSFTSRRYLCKWIRCTDEKRYSCEQNNKICQALELLSDFTHRYLRSYGPLHETNKEYMELHKPKPTKLVFDMKDKDSLQKIKIRRSQKNKPKRKAIKNAE